MLRIIKFCKLMFSFIDRLHVSSLSQGCDPEGGEGGGALENSRGLAKLLPPYWELGKLNFHLIVFLVVQIP